MVRPAQPDSWRNGFKKFLFVAIRLLRYLSPCLGSQDWGPPGPPQPGVVARFTKALVMTKAEAVGNAAAGQL